MAAKVRYQTDRLLAHPEHADQLVADMLGWVEEDGTRHTGFAAEGRRLMFRGGSRPLTILCDCGDRVRVEHHASVLGPAVVGAGDAGVENALGLMQSGKGDGSKLGRAGENDAQRIAQTEEVRTGTGTGARSLRSFSSFLRIRLRLSSDR